MGGVGGTAECTVTSARALCEHAQTTGITACARFRQHRAEAEDELSEVLMPCASMPRTLAFTACFFASWHKIVRNDST